MCLLKLYIVDFDLSSFGREFHIWGPWVEIENFFILVLQNWIL